MSLGIYLLTCCCFCSSSLKKTSELVRDNLGRTVDDYQQNVWKPQNRFVSLKKVEFCQGATINFIFDLSHLQTVYYQNIE